MKKLIQINYFISRKKWAQSSYEEKVRFVASLGAQNLADHILTAPENATYLSDATANEIMNLIGRHSRKNLMEKLRKVDAFAFLLTRAWMNKIVNSLAST